MFQKIKKYFSGPGVVRIEQANLTFAPYEDQDCKFSLMSEIRKNPVVNRCIDLLASSVGSVPLLVKGGGKADLVRSGLNSPNGEEDISRFLQKLVIRLLVDGGAYVLATPSERVNIYVLPKASVSLIKDADGKRVGYSYRSISGERKIMLDAFGRCDLFEVQYCCPFGVSPCESVARSVKLYNSMMIRSQSIIDNSALFSGFFAFRKTSDSRLSKEDLENLRNDIDKKLGEKNAGYAPILPPGMEWEQLKYADAYDPTNLQVYMTMEIAQVFGIPSVMLENGRRTAAFSVNYKEARLHFWEDTILPLVKRITSAFEYFFRKRFLDNEIWIEPDLSKVHVFNDKNIDRMLALDKVGFLSMEEKRRLSGMVEESGLGAEEKHGTSVDSHKGRIDGEKVMEQKIKEKDENGESRWKNELGDMQAYGK